MDGGITLTADEIKGRNTWIVWTAGNDKFWDEISETSVGNLDFLKTLSSYPGLKANRDNRWQYLGLVNEPCYVKATGPDPKRYGLWLDQRSPDCPPEPFENEQKYPGVKIGSRGTSVATGSYYGYATGIVGLRLFPNPNFDEKAAKNWDPVRYYSDPKYYLSKDLVKPYRVGMSCAFCHVGPNPLKPPPDPENPRWEHLSSNVGAQYFWWDRVFDWRGKTNEASFLHQALHTSLPGTLDTSLVSTDNINNPRTMNAVYLLGPRMTLISSVHLGQNYNNAFWNGEQMAYGDGDGSVFIRFTKSLDVVGHELTHGVVSHTSNLEYRNESGALNEHFADVFGSLVKQWKKKQTAAKADWLIGPDIMGPGTKAKSLRTFKEGKAYENDPNLGTDPQPKHLSGKYTGPSDSGGVHINSGIPNHAFFLVATALGGSAWVKAGDIWYRTMLALNPHSDFAQMVTMSTQMAAQPRKASAITFVLRPELRARRTDSIPPSWLRA